MDMLFVFFFHGGAAIGLNTYVFKNGTQGFAWIGCPSLRVDGSVMGSAVPRRANVPSQRQQTTPEGQDLSATDDRATRWSSVRELANDAGPALSVDPGLGTPLSQCRTQARTGVTEDRHQTFSVLQSDRVGWRLSGFDNGLVPQVII